MFSKTLKSTMAAALIATAASAPAFADNLGAAIVGGLIGGVLVNEASKNKKRTYTSTNSVTRQQNRETQTALNYFGFPAGTPDGVMGARSRTASSNYQAFMGFPATGRLTQYERDFLVSSYSRAQIGGPQVIKAMQGPQGVRGLLITWRDEAAGTRTAGYSSGYGGLPIEVSQAIDEIAASSDPSADQLMQRSGFMQLVDLNSDGKNDYILDTSVSGSSFWCGVSHCSVMVFASTPQGYQRNDFMARDITPASFSCHQGVCRINDSGGAPMVTQAPTPQPSMPQTVMTSGQGGAQKGLGGIQPFNMTPAAPQQASLASHCSKVSLLTNSNGGFMTVSTMTDPDQALSEQFCLTRTYAIGMGENMVSKVQGASQAQIDAQCDAFGPATQPYVDMLGGQDALSVKAEVQKFVLGSNMSIGQLASTAKICLYSGYRRDKMDVALGSALLMVGIGQTPYAELVGHHLSQGYGVSESVTRAQDWYGMATTALDNGIEPVFAPGQPERVNVIKAASAALTGEGTLPMASPASTLPTFKME